WLTFQVLNSVIVRWQQAPVTVLRFIRDTRILVGCGNRVHLYDVPTGAVLWTWTFSPFVVVHHIFPLPLLHSKLMVVAVGGSRFYAGLLMGSSSHDISELFIQYRSDNIVYCSAKPSENSVLFCFLSAHYETIFVRVILNEGRLVTVTEARTPLKSSLCYSGLVEYRWKTTFVDSMKFVGSTFGRIDIFCSKLDFLIEEPCLHSEFHVGVLTSQKGAIFSVDFLRVPSLKCMRLCSAAEDRSIAVWSQPLKKKHTDLESEFFGSWCLLYLLKGGGIGDEIIFEARIWKVGLNEHGLLAVGEDCRIVWYPWGAMHKRIVMSDLHRGHGVWSADAYFPDDNSRNVMLATGGNDGAVYVQSWQMNGYDSLTVSFELNVNNDTARSKVKPDCSRVPHLVCTDLMQLGKKIMKIVWTSDTSFLVGLQNGPAVFLTTYVLTDHSCLFGERSIHFTLPPGCAMRWANAACCPQITDTCGFKRSVMIIGTRDGGLYSYLFSCSCQIPLKSDFPRCLFFGPDGRLFCLSDMGFLLTPSVTFDSFTNVRPFFRYAVSELLLKDRCRPSVTVNQSIAPNSFVPSDLRSWCQKVFRGYTVSGTNRSHSLAVIGDKQGQLGLFQFIKGLSSSLELMIYFMDLQCVDFKAFLLTSHNESDNSELTLSFEALNKLVRFQASCGGGNRYWDCWIPDVDGDSMGSRAQLVLVEYTNNPGTFALQVVEHTPEQSCPFPTLASVNRGVVVMHTWRTATRKTCSLASDLICLRPSLHGRDVNCCLLLSTASTGRSCNYESGDDDQTDGPVFYCFAGSEDTCLSSW
ncbi:hypothetical protein AHF37_03311, partial [Paragonimus kellicotti]